jgi:hypothetical protein
MSVDASGIRSQNVFLRHESEVGAMGQRERMGNKIKYVFRRICCLNKSESLDVSIDASEVTEQEKIKQYRLVATQTRKETFWRRIFCCKRETSKQSGVGITPNQALAQYLHWMFRVNFVVLFALCCLVFFALTILFAGFITIAGRIDPQCVRIGGMPFGFDFAAFADAFALSWTTFSTVGYGSTYPALGWQNESPTNCVFITAICSLEAFIGVLYSGFCGAVLFGKVLRIQSHAQVIFSDPLVIRYGDGVEPESFGEDLELGAPRNKFHIPCPVLEFRIINRLYSDVGGEIVDATLHAVANVDAHDSNPLNSNADSSARYVSSERASTADSGSEWDYESNSEAGTISTRSSHMSKLFASVIGGKKDRLTIQEDPSARLVGKRIFSKMHIEASEHPFFKRVWLARHVLDHASPLLTQKTRRAIRRNGGFWPAHLNSYEAVRRSLDFNQILVSLNGVSNVSAADVYAQKIYDIVDVNIGYQFVNVLYRDAKDGTLKVDTTLINDVREQKGGGGEPLLLGQ